MSLPWGHDLALNDRPTAITGRLFVLERKAPEFLPSLRHGLLLVNFFSRKASVTRLLQNLFVCIPCGKLRFQRLSKRRIGRNFLLNMCQWQDSRKKGLYSSKGRPCNRSRVKKWVTSGWENFNLGGHFVQLVKAGSAICLNAPFSFKATRIKMHYLVRITSQASVSSSLWNPD